MNISIWIVLGILLTSLVIIGIRELIISGGKGGSSGGGGKGGGKGGGSGICKTPNDDPHNWNNGVIGNNKCQPTKRNKNQSGDDCPHNGYCKMPSGQCIQYQGTTTLSSDVGVQDAPSCCTEDQGDLYTGLCCNNNLMPPLESLQNKINCSPTPPKKEINCTHDSCFSQYCSDNDLCPTAKKHSNKNLADANGHLTGFDTSYCTSLNNCGYFDYYTDKDGNRATTEKDTAKTYMICLEQQNGSNLEKNLKSTLSTECLAGASGQEISV